MPRIVVLSGDLTIGSAVSGAAAQYAWRVDQAWSLAELPEKLAGPAPQALIVDLSLRTIDPAAVVQIVRAASVDASMPVVAFGPHVQGPLLAQARASGMTHVLTRGQFHASLGELMAQWADRCSD